MNSLFELGRDDFARGAMRSPSGDGSWGERVAGWDAAYRDSLAKAAGGLRRVHAGRYESEDGQWSILEITRGHWSLLFGLTPSYRNQVEIMCFPTFADAMDAIRAEATTLNQTGDV